MSAVNREKGEGEWVILKKKGIPGTQSRVNEGAGALSGSTRLGKRVQTGSRARDGQES